jgi:peroxiredoxin
MVVRECFWLAGCSLKLGRRELHHKSDDPLRLEDVKKYARKLGFKFPVAIDPDWRTLKRWWLDTGDRDWTSVSFLIDRHGVIRHIHPGGQYVKGDKAYSEMKAKIEELLREK